MDNNLVSALESILFIAQKAMTIEEIEKIIKVDKSFIVDAVDILKARYEEQESGLCLINTSQGIRIGTKRENSIYIEQMLPKNKVKKLSNASLEVLSIICYKQPITRAEIDDIRGVDSNNYIRNLIDFGLIEQIGKLESIGRPNVYGTTQKFLDLCEIDSIEDLPKVNVYDNLTLDL